MPQLLLFTVLSALVDVFAGNRLQHTDPGSVAAVAFTAVGVVFCATAAARTRWRPLLAVARRHSRDLLALNLATAVTWVSLLYALDWMEPAVANVVSIAIGPAFTVIMQALWMRGDRMPAGQIAAAGGILVVLALLIASSIAGYSAVGHHRAALLAAGAAAAVVSGAASAATLVFSARLSAAGLDVRTVLGLRFPLVAVAGWVLVALSGGRRLGSAVTTGLVVAVIGVALPALLIQLGIRRVTPLTASMIITLAPAVTLLLQLADPRLAFSPRSTVGIAVITVLIGFGLLTRRDGRRARRPEQEEEEQHALHPC